ncbi:hypothetical protein BHM03_00036527, partial [Ensete ventricosum]
STTKGSDPDPSVRDTWSSGGPRLATLDAPEENLPRDGRDRIASLELFETGLTLYRQWKGRHSLGFGMCQLEKVLCLDGRLKVQRLNAIRMTKIQKAIFINE